MSRRAAFRAASGPTSSYERSLQIDGLSTKEGRPHTILQRCQRRQEWTRGTQFGTAARMVFPSFGAAFWFCVLRKQTQTHTHTNTQTHKHTNTQTHKHTNTNTHTHKKKTPCMLPTVHVAGPAPPGLSACPRVSGTTPLPEATILEILTCRECASRSS